MKPKIEIDFRDVQNPDFGSFAIVVDIFSHGT